MPELGFTSRIRMPMEERWERECNLLVALVSAEGGEELVVTTCQSSPSQTLMRLLGNSTLGSASPFNGNAPLRSFFLMTQLTFIPTMPLNLISLYLTIETALGRSRHVT